MNKLLIAHASGTLFGIGLGVSGMTQPARIRAFLDVTGAWDASLALVMLGAIAVHAPFAMRAKRAHARPLLAASYVLPTKVHIDRSLVVGAAFFGLGWGAAGLCPGPAVASLALLEPATLLFAATMLLGMGVYELTQRRAAAPPVAAVVSADGRGSR